MTGPETFRAKVDAAVRQNQSLVCVGLDPDQTQFPHHLRDRPVGEAIVEFNTAIIEATHDLVCAYKPNFGFYLAFGLEGIQALLETQRRIPAHIPVILDCKVGDMANTSQAYARAYFQTWNFDAITVNAYQGEDAVSPYLDAEGHGVFILTRTSNPGSGDLQDLIIEGAGIPVYLRMAEQIATWQTRHPATIGMVVGATYPAELESIRQRCPDTLILLPGVGAQGGDVEASLRAGLTPTGDGLLVSASRSILYASSESNFAQTARQATLTLRTLINTHRPTPTSS